MLTDTVLLAGDKNLDSFRRCVRPKLLSGAFEFVDRCREVFDGKGKFENMRSRKRRLLACVVLCGVDASQTHAGEEFDAMFDQAAVQNCSDIKVES
jgi:hypothetical protein